MVYSYTIVQDVDWQTKAQWQMPDTPFMSFEFWQALSDSNAIGGVKGDGRKSGWLTHYIVMRQEDGLPIAVMPVFIKNHHQGEYVFDHMWAQAYAQYGINYYPRLVTSVPYTPVPGQRIWLAKGIRLTAEILTTAMVAVNELAEKTGASSWHGLFMQADVAELAAKINAKSDKPNYPDTLNTIRQHLSKASQANHSPTFDTLMTPSLQLLIERQGTQFIWRNQNLVHRDEQGNAKPFNNFDDFLATLTAKKRKNIRAERKKVAKQNLLCRLKLGNEITSADWEVFYQCYAMTYAIRGRHPYLTPAFFTQLGRTMPQHLMMAQALDNTGTIVASSLFFYDNLNNADATLYGRYWGALAEFDSLHFELCYYQGIEFAIAKGLRYFDPGTQGEHKLIRGFVPTKTHSLHQIFDPRFEPAIADFCEQDCAYMQQYRQQAHESLPFNIANMPNFQE